MEWAKAGKLWEKRLIEETGERRGEGESLDIELTSFEDRSITVGPGLEQLMKLKISRD